MAKASDPLAGNIRNDFPFGYRNREDVSVISPNIMVKGSQNVLTNTFKRVGSRPGYVLDGQRSPANTGQGIYGSFDWRTHYGTERNLRVGFNSTGSDGVLQYRYVAEAGQRYLSNTFTEGQVYWIDLYSSVGSSYYACRFWDFTNELKDLNLWVDGTSNIFMWSGAVSTIAETSWATGSVAVLASAPTAGGAGYVVGDILTITTGGTGATLRVAAHTAGVVTAVTLLTPGSGYTTGGGKVTSGGTGAGCTVDITTIAQGFIRLTDTAGVGAGGQGFLVTNAYTKSVTANTNNYTYSYITGAYLVGLSANPTAEPVDSIIHQTPQVLPNAGMSGIPATLKNQIIENLNNQIYVSGAENNSVYISAINNFQSYTFSTPRVVGEGARLTLDGVPTRLQPQSDSMFMSAGKDYWYQTKFTLSADNAKEAITIVPIKTTSNQACQAPGLAVKIKNLIAFVSNEVQINTMGLSSNFLTDPQVNDISGSIVHDVQNADFTDGRILYFQKFLFVTKPKEGIMLIYNMTADADDSTVGPSNTHYWEAPQVLPFGCLSIIGGELYGHAYSESNTFKLFTGLSDDGKPYRCLALFAYDSHGDRTATKSSNEFFVEGYKTQATKLTGYLRREFNGPVSSWSWRELPSRNIIPVIDDASIGKAPIGSVSIGGTAYESDPLSTPPKFRLVQTFNKTPYFEEQIGFGSDEIGSRWELVSFSTNATLTSEGQSSIYDPPLAS
mgnify:CR=1 FL=1